jgi:hypothetical protein
MPTLSMKDKLIPDNQGFQVSLETRRSFSGQPAFFDVSGLGTLVRLVQFSKSTYDGLELNSSSVSGRPGKPSFWFEEEMLLDLLRQARQYLTQQQAAAGRPFSTPLPVLVGNYMRHCLRQDLAVCKDWTNDFDAFVRLHLMPQDHITPWSAPLPGSPRIAKIACNIGRPSPKIYFWKGRRRSM